MGDFATDLIEAAGRSSLEADYYDVCYLKQAEKDGPWIHGCASFPTEAAAEEHAGILREGRHGAVKVVPRWWPLG